MQEREREVPAPQSNGSPIPDDDSLDIARARADRLFRAADRAIARALSTDSRAFLEANRQMGGQ